MSSNDAQDTENSFKGGDCLTIFLGIKLCDCEHSKLCLIVAFIIYQQKNEDFLWTQKTLGLFYFHEWQISWLNKIWQILNSKLMTWFTHSWESNNKNIFLNLSSIPSNFIIEPNLSYNIKFTQCVFVNKKNIRQKKTKVYKSKLREVKQKFFFYFSRKRNLVEISMNSFCRNRSSVSH